jgi:hypothetical protein
MIIPLPILFAVYWYADYSGSLHRSNSLNALSPVGNLFVYDTKYAGANGRRGLYGAMDKDSYIETSPLLLADDNVMDDNLGMDVGLRDEVI